jgi:asparagine synthase (glutamine-hydrolysing)
MGHSVEGRVPFLDHKLFEYVATLPLDVLTRDACGKWLLRQAVGDKLPGELRERRKKIFLSPSPEVLGLFGRSALMDEYLSARSVREIGVLHPWAPWLVRNAMRVLPRGSYFYGLLEGALIFALSLHILHRMFCTSFQEFADRFAPPRSDLTPLEMHRVRVPAAEVVAT